MDKKDVGILLNGNNIKLHRQYFKQTVKLIGINVIYRAPMEDKHWFVFTSRRGDGLYTRLYLACIDDKGNVSKPFLLPQRNPKKYYDELQDSYNTPDFTSKPVELDARAAGNEIMSDKRIATKVK